MLGVTICAEGGAAVSVRARLCKARGAFYRDIKFYESRGISRNEKLKRYVARVQSVAAYGG
eukprot:6178976-Lingulodinium_polyedra.AAC.1